MKVLWFVSSLEQKGGGERFVLEGASAIRANHHEVIIVSDRVGPEASFDGRYDLSGVRCTGQAFDPGAGYLRRVFAKAAGLAALFRILREEAPDLVICQSEFDAIKLYALSKVLRFRYRTFIFGQMFQFKSDISKYATVFRRHLEAIVASSPGYRETVSLPPPRLSPLVWLVNEVVSRLKRRAIRASDRVFTLSNQVRWEVQLLYGMEAEVCRAAFSETYLDPAAISAPKPVGAVPHFISVCRLVDKKRVDLIIRAFGSLELPARLTVLGSGPEEDALRALAASTPRAGDIAVLGQVSDERLEALLGAADCFVSMDIADYNISVVEAMGKGLRVIVARDFDLAAIGDSVTGVLVVDPTEAALAEALRGIHGMMGPSSVNLPALQRVTWEHMAKACLADSGTTC